MSDEQYAQELREELLLKAFRELSPIGQKKVIDYADDIKEKYAKEPEEIVVEWYYWYLGGDQMGIKESMEYFNSLPKDVLDVIHTQEFYDYRCLISDYRVEFRFSSDEFAKETEKLSKDVDYNSDFLKKYFPKEFLALELKTRIKILEEALERKVLIPETASFKKEMSKKK